MRRVALAGLLLVAGCASSAVGPPVPIGGAAAELLGEERIAFLADPERVTALRIEGSLPFERDPDDRRDTIATWPLVAVGPQLTPAQAALVRDLAFDDASYRFRTRKGCAFTPGVALRHERGGSHMDVLLCFRCREWAFVLDREAETEGPFSDEDFDPVLAPLTQLVQELFPDDEALAALN